jgi:signal peptidase I
MKRCASISLAIIGALLCTGCRKSVQLSGGMSPTITNNEQVTINYFAYALAGPRRWDVVVLEGPPPMLPADSKFLKRVIALPGETIDLTSAGIVVNGSLIKIPTNLSYFSYVAPVALPNQTKAGLVAFPYTVPPKHYFVVGDNWTNSLDSRHYGAVALTNILGRVKDK